MIKKILFLGVVLVVIFYFFGSLTVTTKPQVAVDTSGGGDAGPIIAGLDKVIKISSSKLSQMFEAPVGSIEVDQLFPPVGESFNVNVNTTIAGLSSANLIDVKTEGVIPEDFKKFAIDGVLFGIARFDALFPDKDFNIKTALGTKHLKLLITDNRQLFNLKNVSTFRHGYVEICPTGSIVDNSCSAPEIRIYFESSKWDGSDYSSINQSRIAHEMFHVAHIYLLSQLNKMSSFSAPGYYWQTESFATVGQRMIPDKEAYLSFGNSLIGESYFKWPKLSNKDYEKSYEISPFVDELTFRSGEGASMLTHWVKESRAGENASFSLMRILGTETNDEIDISRFQDLYIRSILNLYYPGIFYPSIDVDARTIGAYAYPENLLNVGSKLPAKINLSVPALGNKIAGFKLSGTSGLEKAKKVQISIDVPNKKASGNIRGVVVALRKGQQELNLCYIRIPESLDSVAKKEARDCFTKNAVVLGIWGGDGKEPIKLDASVLRALGSEATINFLMLNTISDATLPVEELVKSIDVSIKISAEETVSKSLGARFFPLIEGDSYGYSGGFGSGAVCYIQQYSNDKPLPSGSSREIFVNIDGDTGEVLGEGFIKTPSHTCDLKVFGKMDLKTKKIIGKISGNSYLRSRSTQWEIENFGILDVSTSFNGTIELDKFRESKYINKTEAIDRTSWVWSGKYSIVFDSSKTDSSIKLDPKNTSNGPRVGQRETGTFSMDMIIKE